MAAPLRRVPKLAAYTVIIVATMLSQCVCENNRKDDPHGTTGPGPVATGDTRGAGPAAVPGEKNAASKLPDTLDTKDLDDDEKGVLVKVLEETYDPCGKSRSFLDSVADPQTCDTAKELAALAVAKVSQGLSARQITQALYAEQARRARKIEVDLNDVPYYGDPNAEVRVVEFTDFECPYCKRFAEPAKTLAKEHGAVLFIKMLPLEEIHPHARPMALAALAANKQGKFWEVYKALFDAQGSVNDENLRLIVAGAGVDMKRYDADVASPAITAQLERDIAEATRFKLQGTPTFFVNGYEVAPEELEAALDNPRE